MSMLRTNLQSFLLGAATSLGAGYFFLHQDVWRSADILSSTISRQVASMSDSTASLDVRVAKLEGEVAALKAVRK